MLVCEPRLIHLEREPAAWATQRVEVARVGTILRQRQRAHEEYIPMGGCTGWMAEDEGSAGGRWLRGGSTEATTPVMVSRWIAAVLARAMTRDGMDDPISRLDKEAMEARNVDRVEETGREDEREWKPVMLR